jgi:hypothetical protein
MKLGTMATAAALAVAMTLSGAGAPADAGKKGKQAHHAGSKKVHISPDVSTKNLRLLEKKLHGTTKHAVTKEIKRRDDIVYERRRREIGAKIVGDFIGGSTDIETHIIGLGVAGTGDGKSHRKGGH